MTDPTPARRAKPTASRTNAAFVTAFYILGCVLVLTLIASTAVRIYRDLTPQPARTVCVYVNPDGITATEMVTVDGRCYGLPAA